MWHERLFLPKCAPLLKFFAQGIHPSRWGNIQHRYPCLAAKRESCKASRSIKLISCKAAKCGLSFSAANKPKSLSTFATTSVGNAPRHQPNARHTLFIAPLAPIRKLARDHHEELEQLVTTKCKGPAAHLHRHDIMFHNLL